jgi:hypothetical protein
MIDFFCVVVPHELWCSMCKTILVALVLVSCSDPGDFPGSSRRSLPTYTGGSSSVDIGSGGAESTGGSKTTGGARTTGGSATSGGTLTTGGVRATGGRLSTGGSFGTGGFVGTGGTLATGGIGSGGHLATGGYVSTGGFSSSCQCSLPTPEQIRTDPFAPSFCYKSTQSGTDISWTYIGPVCL